MKLRDIPTPALVIDLPAMERNIKRMADFYDPHPRPLSLRERGDRAAREGRQA